MVFWSDSWIGNKILRRMTQKLASCLTAKWVKVGNKWPFFWRFSSGGHLWRQISMPRSRDIRVILIFSCSGHPPVCWVNLWRKSDNSSSSYSNGSRRDRQSHRQTDRQSHSGHHNTDKMYLSKTLFCGKNVKHMQEWTWLNRQSTCNTNNLLPHTIPEYL